MIKEKKGLIGKAAIIIGVLIIPLMYSYFYLQAFWDPYERLDDVDVAVVNLDQGGKVNGETRNLGDDICDNLKEDGSLGFVFTDEADAEDGLLNQKYYATITIPADFTSNVSTISKDTDKLHSQIVYKANQKKNYLASQILENAMPKIKESVNSSIDKEIIATLCDELNAVPDKMGNLQDGFDKLSDGSTDLHDGTTALSDGAGDLADGAKTLSEGADALADGSDTIYTGMGSLDEGIDKLNSSVPALSKGVKDLKNGAKDIDDGADAVSNGAGTLSKGASKLDKGINDYTKGVETASSGAGTLATGLKTYTEGVASASEGADTLCQGIQDASDGVDTMVTSVNASIESLETSCPDASLDALTAGMKNVKTAIAGAQQCFDAYNKTGDIQYLQKGQYILGQLDADTMTTLTDGVSNLADGMKSVKTNTATLATGLTALQSGFGDAETEDTLIYGANALSGGLSTLASNNETLTTGMNSLNSGLSTLASKNEELTGGSAALASGAKDLSDGASELAKGTSKLSKGTKKLNKKVPTLKKGVSALAAGSEKLVKGSKSLKDGMDELATGSGDLYNGTLTLENGAIALDSGAQQLADGITIASDGVDESVEDSKDKLKKLNGLDDYSEEPVTVDTEYIQPVANYGSAFAPYFMGLSLWVGGLMIFFGIYFDYKRKIRSLTKDEKSNVKKSAVFAAISAGQGVCLALVIKYALGIAVNNMGLLIMSCILTALTFMVIIQFFVMYTGNIGKFMALLLLILQLTSSAGTFPIETQSQFFITISKVLPMTYSTQLFKEAISGTAGDWAVRNAVIMVVFLAVFTAANLVCEILRSKRKGYGLMGKADAGTAGSVEAAA